MLAVAFPAAAFATNCYVLAPGPGEECVIVDPGIGVEDATRMVFFHGSRKPHELDRIDFIREHWHADDLVEQPA